MFMLDSCLQLQNNLFTFASHCIQLVSPNEWQIDKHIQNHNARFALLLTQNLLGHWSDLICILVEEKENACKMKQTYADNCNGMSLRNGNPRKWHFLQRLEKRWKGTQKLMNIVGKSEMKLTERYLAFAGLGLFQERLLAQFYILKYDFSEDSYWFILAPICN